MEGLGQYWKAVVVLLGSIAAAIASGVGNGELGDLGTQDWVLIVLAILGGTGLTWWVENIAGLAGGIIKAVVASSTAFLVAIQTGYATDGAISQAELLVAIGAGLVTLAATYQVPGPVPAEAVVVPTREVGGTTRRTT